MNFLRCSLQLPKSTFYRVANAIFDKVDRMASEEDVLGRKMLTVTIIRDKSLSPEENRLKII